MSKRVMAMLASVVALAVLVGACGGSDDDGDSGGEPLTKAQYVKQANKICAKEGERLGKEMVAYGEKRNPEGSNDAPSKAEQKKETELTVSVVLIPGFRAEVAQLEELTPPEADEEQIEAMLEKFNTGLEEGEEDPNAFFTETEFEKGTEAANKYGLKGCGILFL